MLSISDWIAFLTNEKSSNISNIIGFSAFVLAAFAIIMSVTNNTWASAVSAALVSVALMIFYVRTIGLYGRHAKEAGELLKDIMSGNERDPSKIEERWKAILAKERKQKNK